MSLASMCGLMLSVLLLTGSVFAQTTAKNEPPVLTNPESVVLKKDALELWQKRVNKETLEEALSKFELVHAANPGDLETLIYLTRGYYFLADAHLDNADLKKKNFEKAVSFGEKALATNAAFQAKLADGKDMEDIVDVLTEKEVPAIYWTAASIGKWAKAEGFFTQIKNKDRILALIKRVETLKPDYFHGAPARYWGGYYALAPSIAGGDLDKSKENFEKSIKMAPEYLGTKVLMAEVYYTKKKDKKAFEAVLREVLTSNQDKHPELGPENTMEKKKAEKLLEKMDDLF